MTSLAALRVWPLAELEFLGFKLGFWAAVGFVAQAVFFSRFLFQWLASERRGHSYVPVYFWWISLSGGGVMLVYAIGIRELPLVVGQAVGLFVYARNLVLIHRKRRFAASSDVEAGDALYVHPDEKPADADPDQTGNRQ